MPTTKLTAAAVKRLPAPQSGDIIYWDTLLPGFGLRVAYGGSRTFIVQARVLKNGRRVSQKKKLGRYPGLELGDARDMARTAMETAEAGGNLGAPRKEREAKALDRSLNTYAAVRDEFLDKYRTRKRTRPRPSTLAEIRRVLSGDLFKDWEDRPLAEITKRDVLDVLDRIIDQGHEVAANRTLTYLKMLMGWAADREIIDTAPTDRIKPPGREESRDRVLDDDELAAIWNATATKQEKECSVFGAIVKVLLLTGQRRNEVAGMQWSELDLDKALWTIPGNRTKNKLAHLVPLSDAVLATIDLQANTQARIGKSAYVFSCNGKTPFSGWSRSKDRLGARSRVAGWTLHDFRRTMVTRMNETLGISPHVVEAVVNHVSGSKSGVAGVYNRALYLDERKRALDAWANHVLGVVEGKVRPRNVIGITAASDHA